MEATIPGRTKCQYVEDSSPEGLTIKINKFLEKYIVIDIKPIQNFKMYGAYIIYLTNDNLTVAKLAEDTIEIGNVL